MRKLLFLISFAIYISSPAVAADNYAAEIQRVKKDECLLVALNCPQPNLKPQEQIRRLRDELNKGSSVYTPEELRILMRKLDDAKATQEFFDRQAPSMQF